MSTRDVWFFDDARRVTRLRDAAEEWIGTPFREHGKAKGKAGGVDCIHLCEALEVAAGVGGRQAFKFPITPMDYSIHNERSLILQHLRGQADLQSLHLSALFSEVWTLTEDEPRGVCVMAGDLLGFKIGKSVHHLAVALENEPAEETHPCQFVHCFRDIGVAYANLRDSTFAPRLHNIFRARAS